MLNDRDYVNPARRGQRLSDFEIDGLVARALMEQRLRARWPWMPASDDAPDAPEETPAMRQQSHNTLDTDRDARADQLLDDLARTAGPDAVGAIVTMRRWREQGGYRADIYTSDQRRGLFIRWLRERGHFDEHGHGRHEPTTH